MLDKGSKNSTVKDRKTMWRAWLVVLVFTAFVVAGRSLYVRDAGTQGKLHQQVTEMVERADAAAGKEPEAVKTSESDPIAPQNELLKKTMKEIDAAKKLPEDRASKEYLDGMARVADLTLDKIKRMEDYIAEVANETPAQSARKLLETPFSRDFSPKNASGLFNDPGEVELAKDKFQDPRIAKILALLLNPAHPDFSETYAALVEEAYDYVNPESDAFATMLGAERAIPLLLTAAPPSAETATLLYEMEQRLRQSDRETMNRAYGGADDYLQGPMSKTLSYSVERLFDAMLAEPELVMLLVPGQVALLSEFESYKSDRGEQVRRMAHILPSDDLSPEEIDRRFDEGGDELVTEDFWGWAMNMIPPPQILSPEDPNVINHELYLFDMLHRFVENQTQQ